MDSFSVRLFGSSLVLYGVGVLVQLGAVSLPLNGFVSDADVWFLCFVFASVFLFFFCVYADKGHRR